MEIVVFWYDGHSLRTTAYTDQTGSYLNPLNYILEFRGSAYPYRDISWFYCVIPYECRDIILKFDMTFAL
jgi:hypothetical protein